MEPARTFSMSQEESESSSEEYSSSSYDYDMFRQRRRKSPVLEVPQTLFSENNKLLEGLSQEVRRLRDENQGLGMSVESLTDENVVLTEKLASFGERVSQLQTRFGELWGANSALQEERNNLHLQVDALSFKLAESESTLKLHREQSEEQLSQLREEFVLRELASRRDGERFQKQAAAMRRYISRLEKECGEQHKGRVSEFSTARQALQRTASLAKELEATRQLLHIEEGKTASLCKRLEEMTGQR